MRSFCLAAAAFAAAALSSVQAATLSKRGLWDDGRAEVAVYDAERVVDGKTHIFREHLITMKEKMTVDAKTMKVLKLNQVQQFETANYPISYLTSVFVKEDMVQDVVKLTVGAQEWNGNTYKMYKEGKLTLNSYVDGEADQTVELALRNNDYFEDQLPLSLRGLQFKIGLEHGVRIWDLLTTNRGQAPQPVEATLTVVREEIVRGRVGSIPCWVVTLKRPTGEDTYWFEKAAPNILIKMVTQDGRKRMLTGRARWSYWDQRLPRPKILNY